MAFGLVFGLGPLVLDTEFKDQRPKPPSVANLLTLPGGACYFLASVRNILLVVAVVALYVLHQDVWFWRSSNLVFGFIPIGLFYQGCFSIAAALLMWLLVSYAWPSHLEEEAEKLDPGEDARR